MKILIFGAGVLGSLYAARLQEAGHEVSILARGRRLQEIRGQGLVLEHALSGQYLVVPIRVIEKLNVYDQYDYIIVLVRNPQVREALALVEKNIETLNILVMVNNVMGYQEWIDAVGRDRLMVGFPGAGGTCKDGVVKYALAPAFFQPTTVAEIDGQPSERLLKLVRAFREAGFPTTTCRNMDAWQKTHVAWVSPLAQAIYMARNEGIQLGDSRNNIKLMIKAIRDSLAALKQLSIPVTPSIMRFWQLLPEPLLVEGVRLWSKTQHFNTLALQHSMVARDEMDQLARQFTALSKSAGIFTPCLNILRQRVVTTSGLAELGIQSYNLPG
ncbi:MAG TPA: 2-dehydropantoate 2-reductase N-terminal domain-containing protein [Anaerolineales bacterium]|nr:2-dehydropantoate 2-reductase N-terminal domain-containing protein [Anaerolineales bacterium]